MSSEERGRGLPGPGAAKTQPGYPLSPRADLTRPRSARSREDDDDRTPARWNRACTTERPCRRGWPDRKLRHRSVRVGPRQTDVSIAPPPPRWRKVSKKGIRPPPSTPQANRTFVPMEPRRAAKASISCPFLDARASSTHPYQKGVGEGVEPTLQVSLSLTVSLTLSLQVSFSSVERKRVLMRERELFKQETRQKM
jgi:hypothetical protein